MPTDRFIARQPILNAKLEVVAYELLFRSDLDNYCKNADSAQASSVVINDSMLIFDLLHLTDGKGAFINMSREGLIAEHARLLPSELATIEILETVEPDGVVLDAVTRLKEAGYRIALDDFRDSPAMQPLIDLADYIKIDVLATPRVELAATIARLRRPELVFLAEKVETKEDFAFTADLGCTLFQGYFFAKPTIVSGKDVPGFRLSYMELLRVINREPFDMDAIEEILRRDVSISYKFLRYINSAAMGLRGHVSTIRETLVLLGQRNIRALASVWALAGLGQHQPEALLLMSVTRARFCDGLANAAGQPQRQNEVFLFGLLSLIDVIVGRPMAELIAELPVTDDVVDALVLHKGPLEPLLGCVQAYEKGDWASVSAFATLIGVDSAAISQIYLDAIPSDVQVALHASRG
jgi:c-di-GMP-related signal transduction protein